MALYSIGQCLFCTLNNFIVQAQVLLGQATCYPFRYCSIYMPGVGFQQQSAAMGRVIC